MNKIKLLKITSWLTLMCFVLGVTFFAIKISHQISHQKDLDSNFKKELAEEVGKINFLFSQILFSQNKRLKEVRSEDPGAIEHYVEILLKIREEKIRKYLNDNPHTTISLEETVVWQNDLKEMVRKLKSCNYQKIDE